MKSTPPRRVLVVDDEPDFRVLVRSSLESFGDLEVVTCATAEEAFRAASWYLPDLLLLDVRLPEMDGPTLLQELRRWSGYESIPAVFLTASDDTSSLRRCREAGCLDILMKPIDPVTLPSLLRRLLEQETAAPAPSPERDGSGRSHGRKATADAEDG